MDSQNLTRPKSTDTEDDLMKMQEDYFKEKCEINQNLQPAAAAIRVESPGT